MRIDPSRFLPILGAVAIAAVATGSFSRSPDAALVAAAAKALQMQERPSQAGAWQRLDMQPFRDGQGVVVVEMPLPPGWKVNAQRKPGEPTIVGPNGVKVVDFPAQAFMYTRDPRLQQAHRMAGSKLRAMPTVEQLIQQDIVPWAAQRGMKLARSYEVPEVSRIDQWYNDQLYKAVPGRSRAWAVGSEWVTASGEPYYILLHLTSSSTAQVDTWSYWATGLQADSAHFAASRDRLVFGLANARYNPEPIAAYNRKEAERAGQSWAAHNRRMAENQARFEASQRAFVNRSNAAHDALMNNWREKNAASDRAHERFVDTITERQKVVDPSSGQQYKVEAGRNHYWMNSDGKYLSTDRQDYDPNRDRTLDNRRWQELKKTD